MSEKGQYLNMKSARNVLDRIFGVEPKSVAGQENITTQFYRERLFRKCMGIFKVDGTPDTFNKQWFLNKLLRSGYCVIAETKEYGLIPVDGALSGLNVYGFPTDFETANPLIVPTEMHIIGETAFVIYMENISPPGSYLFKGVMDLVNQYSQKLASIDKGVDVNLMNSMVAYVFSCENDAQYKTVKNLYADITAGNPAVFVRKRDIDNLRSDGGVLPFFNNVKNSFIVPELHDAKTVIMNEFLTEIGINNAPVSKRERVQNAETESNNGQIENAAECWLRNIMEEGFDKLNKVLGYNITVTRTQNIDEQTGGSEDYKDAIQSV